MTEIPLNPDGTMYVCTTCGRQVDPNSPDVVQAHELIFPKSMAGNDEPIEGSGHFFHRQHYPHGSKLYRLTDDRP